MATRTDCRCKVGYTYDMLCVIFLELCFNCSSGISEFKSVAKEVCKLPSFFSTSLFRKIDVNSTGFVTRYYSLFLTVGEK